MGHRNRERANPTKYYLCVDTGHKSLDHVPVSRRCPESSAAQTWEYALAAAKGIDAVIISEQYERISPYVVWKRNRNNSNMAAEKKWICNGRQQFGPWFYLFDIKPIYFDKLLFNTERYDLGISEEAWGIKRNRGHLIISGDFNSRASERGITDVTSPTSGNGTFLGGNALHWLKELMHWLKELVYLRKMHTARQNRQQDDNPLLQFLNKWFRSQRELPLNA